ncbi:helix-turn-helix domain-containing protein [Halobacillus naozhouensis]|uniref:Helix-turn-helix domain-containing protein n=1 Tax=Halobacillus naozhouensis TaxID=554880 RepID=A0ABY8IXT9_9BACI|nr:helix-turn-helix domain-containing protein [Halobacillus naozhouensis]WFT75062.1 helix-turn-helix domain-containing protein [Halobacillus naozhouensis]
MTRLIELAKQAQNNDTTAMKAILELFEPKIKYSLKQTTPQEQEDLYQELTIRTIEIIRQYDIESTPGFWEFKHEIESRQ